MARLDDLLPELKDTDTAKLPLKINESNTLTGKKRRAWLIEESDEKKSSQEKGSIEHINKPYSSIQTFKTESNSSKGSMNPVHKQRSLCYADLRSNPLQLFRYLYELAKNAEDDYKTPRVKLRDMMLQINISKDSARTALRFLLKQKFIERIEFQSGQLGWSRYRLNEKICGELIKAMGKGVIDPFYMVEKKGIESHETNPAKFMDPWEEVETSSLESIGFNRKHLLQLKNKSTPDVTQESINHFAYSLKNNKKTQEYPNPLATFMAVLKRGEAWIEPNYRSPQELAQQQFLEFKKAELERKKKLEEDAFNLALAEWQESLSNEEFDNITAKKKGAIDITPQSSKLSAYFRDTIWPSQKKMYLITEE